MYKTDFHSLKKIVAKIKYFKEIRKFFCFLRPKTLFLQTIHREGCLNMTG